MSIFSAIPICNVYILTQNYILSGQRLERFTHILNLRLNLEMLLLFQKVLMVDLHPYFMHSYLMKLKIY